MIRRPPRSTRTDTLSLHDALPILRNHDNGQDSTQIFKRGKVDAMSKGKVIISCAVTGAIHTPSMSPHLPVTAQEIADSAVAAAEAGAAIIHLHARNPQ